MHQIKISDLIINVERKQIKNLHLSVNPPNGRVRIATPLNIDDDAVRLFAISKLGWIRRQQRKFEGQARQSEREYVSGESHYFWGKRYILNVVYRKGNPEVIIRNKTHIDLCVREKSTQIQREIVLREWYRRQLKAVIPDLITKWEKIIGVKLNDWGVMQMKTKWGTCNIEEKRILLNLELTKKPEHCLEYIVAHELVHLLERKHNDRYIALMDQFMPLWRTYRDELNHFPLGHAEWKY